MIGASARKLFGSSNERLRRVAAINALEPEIAALSGDALRARAETFKKQLAEGASRDVLTRNPRSDKLAQPPAIGAAGPAKDFPA